MTARKSRKWEQQKIAEGLCKQCGHNPYRPNRRSYTCEECNEKILAYQRTPKFRAKERITQAAYRKRLRTEIIAGYGGACQCCGEECQVFLTIEHVNGNGKIDRARGLSTMRLGIIKANFPPDYEVLCFNCNSGRALNKGICPHQSSTP